MFAGNKSSAGDRDRFHPAGERGPIKPFDFDPERYVFISFPRTTDSALLRAIVRSLLRRQVSVWMYDPAPCRLSKAELRGVNKQVSLHDWEKEALDALAASRMALLLIGERTLSLHEGEPSPQMKEIVKGAARELYISARVDATPFEAMPAAIRRKKILNLDATAEDPMVVAARIEEIADEIGKIVLGRDFRPVRKEGAIAATAKRFAPVVVTAGVFLVAGWFAAPTVSFHLTPPTAHEGPRLALIIAQSAYNGDSIRIVKSANTEADAIERALDQLNFEIDRRRNLTRAELVAALGEFEAAVRKAGQDAAGFIYYTGHGVQHPSSADNYFLGIDAQIDKDTDVEKFGVNLTEQRDRFAALKTTGMFIVFDACRNVLPETKSADKGVLGTVSTKGLTPLPALDGMIVAYSTLQGMTAEEGVYAPILAEELVRPGRKIEYAFLEAKDRVANDTAGKQRPYNEANIHGLCLSCPAAE